MLNGGYFYGGLWYPCTKKQNNKPFFSAKGIMNHEKAMDIDAEDLVPLAYKTKRDYFNAIKKLKKDNYTVFFDAQGLEKEYKEFVRESAQMNETRGYTVTAELGVPDNMNNRDIEDEVERLLRTSNKINVVMDVTAERK